MNNLLIKIICVFLVLVAFAEYNSVTATRLAEETVAKVEAEAASAGAAGGAGSGGAAESAGAGYKDGKYVGSAQGYGGTVSVEVTIEGGSITNIEAIAHGGEDAAYWDMCSGVIPQLIETQGAKADTVSGATFSSTGIINATIDALSQAM
ncbi:MAG: FMN-binding protein [Firmicutes bacterium]|nr:FMN-binding protein [Bacillota bacterium]